MEKWTLMYDSRSSLNSFSFFLFNCLSWNTFTANIFTQFYHYPQFKYMFISYINVRYHFVSSVIVLWIRLDSDDDFRSGYRNVSQCHHKQSFWGLHSAGRSKITELWKADMSVSLKCLSRYVFSTVHLKHLTFSRFLVNPTCFYCLEELNGGEAVKKRNSKQLI